MPRTMSGHEPLAATGAMSAEFWHHTRLEIHTDSKALDAVVEAATCLNCPIGEIQVEGPEWPLYPEKN